MSFCIGVIAQKGGVGKSTIACELATAFTKGGRKVLLADMDAGQGSLVKWNQRREKNILSPAIDTRAFHAVSEAIAMPNFDLLIFDGSPTSTRQTQEIFNVSNLSILPTGCSLFDLEPQVILAHELTERGGEDKVLFVLSKVPPSKKQIRQARTYLESTGYVVAQGEIPDKVALAVALTEGRSISEVKYPTLVRKVEEVIQAIVNRFEILT